MQTRGQQQFKFSRQVIVIIGLCLAALALPLGGVIVMLQGLAKSRAPQEAEAGVSEALQSRLEGIVDKKLAPGEVSAGETRIELVVEDVKNEKARIDRLVASYGGSAIPRSESETEVRLLVQVPPKQLEAFLLACRGRQGAATGDLGFLEIVIKKSRSQ